jgi:NADP-dependent 3-hydroxy acid dehydrogenase YdfG
MKVLPQMRTQKSGLIINITSIAGYMGLPYRSIYSASKGFRTNNRGSSHGSKVLWDSYHERCSGDFATNIASGRYHAPVIKGSAYEVSYGESLRTMDEHVDGGSNPNEMAEAVIKLFKLKNLKYIIK